MRETFPLSTAPEGWRWSAHPDSTIVAREIAEKFDRIRSLPGCEVIKESFVRTVYRVPLGGDRPDLFIKHYRSRGLRDALKYLFVKNKARKEWEVAGRLSDAGINVPKMVAFGERRRGPLLKDACLVMEAIPDTRFIQAYFSPSNSRASRERRDSALAAIAELVAALHKRKIFHPDLHSGNFLFTTDSDGSPVLHLVDLHAVKFPRCFQRRHRVESLAVLMQTLLYFAWIPPRHVRRTWDRYAAASSLDADESAVLLTDALVRMERIRRSKEKKRTMRCVGRSSRFVIERSGRQKIYRSRTISREEVLNALDEHRSRRPAGPDDTITSAGLRVRQWPASGWRRWLRGSTARRAWIAANGLAVRGIPTPEALAMVEEKGACRLITRHDPARTPLCDVLPEVLDSPAEQKKLARALADEVGKLHARGVHHADLSLGSFLVERRPEGWRALIADVENIEILRAPTAEERLAALAGLNTLPEGISPAARAAFVAQYNAHVAKGIDRQAMAKIEKISMSLPH